MRRASDRRRGACTRDRLGRGNQRGRLGHRTADPRRGRPPTRAGSHLGRSFARSDESPKGSRRRHVVRVSRADQGRLLDEEHAGPVDDRLLRRRRSAGSQALDDALQDRPVPDLRARADLSFRPRAPGLGHLARPSDSGRCGSCGGSCERRVRDFRRASVHNSRVELPAHLASAASFTSTRSSRRSREARRSSPSPRERGRALP